MDIGKEKREIVVEPMVAPVPKRAPAREPAPAPQRAPKREPAEAPERKPIRTPVPQRP